MQKIGTSNPEEPPLAPVFAYAGPLFNVGLHHDPWNLVQSTRQ